MTPLALDAARQLLPLSAQFTQLETVNSVLIACGAHVGQFFGSDIDLADTIAFAPDPVVVRPVGLTNPTAATGFVTTDKLFADLAPEYGGGGSACGGNQMLPSFYAL
jgi:hypothetical protein